MARLMIDQFETCLGLPRAQAAKAAAAGTQSSLIQIPVLVMINEERYSQGDGHAPYGRLGKKICRRISRHLEVIWMYLYFALGHNLQQSHRAAGESHVSCVHNR